MLSGGCLLELCWLAAHSAGNWVQVNPEEEEHPVMFELQWVVKVRAGFQWEDPSWSLFERIL